MYKLRIKWTCKQCGIEFETMPSENRRGGRKFCSKQCELKYKHNRKESLKTRTIKVCTTCNKEKPIQEFHKHSQSSDGKRWCCKECTRRKLIEYGASHVNEKKIYDKEYRIKNEDNIKLNQKNWVKTSKGKALSARTVHKRRALAENTETTLTAEEWNKILELQNNRCTICGKKFTKKNQATRDHIIPLYEGGGLTFENVQAVHQGCNTRKGKKIDKTNIVSWIARPELCGELI